MNYKMHTVGAIAATFGLEYLESKTGIQSNPMYLMLLGG